MRICQLNDESQFKNELGKYTGNEWKKKAKGYGIKGYGIRLKCEVSGMKRVGLLCKYAFKCLITGGQNEESVSEFKDIWKGKRRVLIECPSIDQHQIRSIFEHVYPSEKQTLEREQNPNFNITNQKPTQANEQLQEALPMAGLNRPTERLTEPINPSEVQIHGQNIIDVGQEKEADPIILTQPEQVPDADPGIVDDNVLPNLESPIQAEKVQQKLDLPKEEIPADQIKNETQAKKVELGSIELNPGKKIEDFTTLLPGDVCLCYSSQFKVYKYVQVLYLDDDKKFPKIALYTLYNREDGHDDQEARWFKFDDEELFQPSCEILTNSRSHPSGITLGTYGQPKQQIRQRSELVVGEVYLHQPKIGINKYVYVEIKKIEHNPYRVIISDSGIQEIPIEKDVLQRFFHTRTIDPAIDLDLGDESPSVLSGLRSMAMRQSLENFPNYKNKKLNFGEREYAPITGNTRDISGQPVASCGSSITREVILLDPNNSPILNQKYQELKNLLTEKRNGSGNLEEAVVLQEVSDFVRSIFYKNSVDIESDLDKFVEQKRKGNDPNIQKLSVTSSKSKSAIEVPFIPIDVFIEDGLGVCRHHALVMAYFLDKLTKEPEKAPFLTGIVQHMRSNVTAGAHVWVTYVSKTQRFHIDSLWNVLEEFTTVSSQSNLAVCGYGFKTIDNQVERANILQAQARQKKS